MKFRLNAAQERRVKTNSNGRVGYVPRLIFAPMGREIRPIIGDVHTTTIAAEREGDTLAGKPWVVGRRYAICTDVQIVRIDALGRAV